jgi:hypothetical protein
MLPPDVLTRCLLFSKLQRPLLHITITLWSNFLSPPPLPISKFSKAAALQSAGTAVRVLLKIGWHSQTSAALMRLLATLISWNSNHFKPPILWFSELLHSTIWYAGTNVSGGNYCLAFIFRVKWTKLRKLAYTMWQEEMDQEVKTWQIRVKNK